MIDDILGRTGGLFYLAAQWWCSSTKNELFNSKGIA